MTRHAPYQIVALALVALLAVGCVQASTTADSPLSYSLLTELTIKAGEYVPGTALQFLGSGERGAHVLIDGQDAWKRVGDSLVWSGEFAEGAMADVSLRVVSHSDDTLRLFGTVSIEIGDPQPASVAIATTSGVTYTGLVGYGVARDGLIPGSTVRYIGSSEEGAELGGVEGYPYRKVGDAIDWEGTLGPGTYISLQVRVVQFDAEAMRVAGLVQLWFGS